MIGRYYHYRCLKCGYKFIKYQSDALVPVICPKCKGNVEVVSSSNSLNPFGEIVDLMIDLVTKDKK